jgi:uncharacterized cupredoxin-like copper-binding protein
MRSLFGVPASEEGTGLSMRQNLTIQGLRAASFACALLATTTGFAASASAAATVKVLLTDPGTGSSAPGMEISATPNTVKRGKVTFEATNKSSGLVHEMILIRQPANGKPLPYNDKEQKVDEHKIKSLGEVSELDPGKSGKLTVNLTPGKYLLFCNQPDHYKSGMFTPLIVTR